MEDVNITVATLSEASTVVVIQDSNSTLMEKLAVT